MSKFVRFILREKFSNSVRWIKIAPPSKLATTQTTTEVLLFGLFLSFQNNRLDPDDRIASHQRLLAIEHFHILKV